MSTEQPAPAAPVAPTPPAPAGTPAPAAAAPAPVAPTAPATPHATNPTEAKAEPNALAQALTGGWEKFKQGQLISYPLMALLLLLVTGVGVTWWIVGERRKAEAAKWVELDGLGNTTALKDFADKYPDTPQARIARLEIARGQLGPEGIERMTATDPTVRKKGVESVEAAREAFAKLADDFKDDRVLKPECLMAAAVAEAVLVGYPKDGQVLNPLDPKPIETRGDPKKVLEWLDKVIEAAPGTEWEKRAKKFADTLRNQNEQQQVRTVQSMIYDLSPALPGMGGLPPGIHGGLPGFGGPVPPVGP